MDAMGHKIAHAYGCNTSVRANFMHHVVPKLEKKIWEKEKVTKQSCQAPTT